MNSTILIVSIIILAILALKNKNKKTNANKIHLIKKDTFIKNTPDLYKTNTKTTENELEQIPNKYMHFLIDIPKGYTLCEYLSLKQTIDDDEFTHLTEFVKTIGNNANKMYKLSSELSFFKNKKISGISLYLNINDTAYKLGDVAFGLLHKIKELNVADTCIFVLDSICVNSHTIDIRYQTLIPKTMLKEFKTNYEQEFATSEKINYGLFYDLPITKTTISLKAYHIIDEHINSTPDGEQNRDELMNLLESFDDPHWRNDFGIKKIAHPLLFNIIKELIAKGHLLSDGDMDYMIIDHLRDAYPDLIK